MSLEGPNHSMSAIGPDTAGSVVVVVVGSGAVVVVVGAGLEVRGAVVVVSAGALVVELEGRVEGDDDAALDFVLEPPESSTPATAATTARLMPLAAERIWRRENDRPAWW